MTGDKQDRDVEGQASHHSSGPPGLGPGSRVSALATDDDAGDDQQPVGLPAPDEVPSFSTHIKPLFRTKDRQAMRFAFDLWSLDDASQHADAILARLRAGTMPCDGAWPPDKIDAFERWIAAGT